MSALLCGVEAVPVTVEVVVSNGLPGMAIVGMVDTAVQEAKERVRSAIQASGFAMPADKIVVNLAPGDLRKYGSGFDLPIALGILAATGQVDPRLLEGMLFIGELSLEGPVRQTVGSLAFGVCAAKEGRSLVSGHRLRVPIDGLEQLTLRSLGRMHGEEPFEEAILKAATQEDCRTSALDFRDIAGHDVAKRALQIAAAGKHGVLMVGPPGSGKTMLASRIPTILPPLEETELLETAVVHSVAGESIDAIMAGRRPFRSPHHSATSAGLLGGGTPVRPGEISLAHHGVLFLDELAEFKTSVLQGLRQPIECGEVCLIRAGSSVRFPSDFMLVAASNPCPCGYFGDEAHGCTCSPAQIQRYQAKIGGPLLDRICLQLDVHRLPTSSVLESGSGVDSATLRDGVMRARAFCQWRKQRKPSSEGLIGGARTGSAKEIIGSCNLKKEATDFLVAMAESAELSGRGLVNTLKVARTIADIEEVEDVSASHLAEALGFRMSEGIGG